MKLSKAINLGTTVIDFIFAVIMFVVAVSAHSMLAGVFGFVFLGMGIYFWRMYERQRRLDKMTPEERRAFLEAYSEYVPGEDENR